MKKVHVNRRMIPGMCGFVRIEHVVSALLLSSTMYGMFYVFGVRLSFLILQCFFMFVLLICTFCILLLYIKQ